MVKEWLDKGILKNADAVKAYQAEAARKSDFERSELNKEKTGVKLEGVMGINPVNDTEIPIFISDYVLSTYGTGAIMAVPAHDTRDWEFAKKFGLPIIEAVSYTHLSQTEIAQKEKAIREATEQRLERQQAETAALSRARTSSDSREEMGREMARLAERKAAAETEDVYKRQVPVRAGDRSGRVPAPWPRRGALRRTHPPQRGVRCV